MQTGIQATTNRAISDCTNYFMSQRQHFTEFLPILWFLHPFLSLFYYASWNVGGVDTDALFMAEQSTATYCQHFIKQESLQLPAAYFKKLLWARLTVTLIYDDKNKNLKASFITCRFIYFIFNLLLFCVYYCLLSWVSVHLIYAVPLEVRRGNWNPWDWIRVDCEPLCKC